MPARQQPPSFTEACDSISTVSSNPCIEAGLSPQANVGIGVGVGLGCTFLIVLAAISLYFRRRAATAVSEAIEFIIWSEPDNTQYPTHQSQPGIPSVEVPGDFVEAHKSVRYELPP